jgi:hypothetical protein
VQEGLLAFVEAMRSLPTDEELDQKRWESHISMEACVREARLLEFGLPEYGSGEQSPEARSGDRELLELAAKAAGYVLTWDGDNPPYPRAKVDSRNLPWNPLIDDGDALRLAVKLSLRVGIAFYYDHHTDQADVTDYNETFVCCEGKADGQDQYAATRRAIVRAAAAIAHRRCGASMRTASITYCGVPLVCGFQYDPAEPRTWDHPGSPANVALCTCKVAGVDLMEMLSVSQQDDIEGLLLEAYGEEEEHNAGEYADMRRNEQQMERGYP